MTDHFVPSRFQQLEHRYLTASLAAIGKASATPQARGLPARLVLRRCPLDGGPVLVGSLVAEDLAIGPDREALAKAGEAAMRQERGGG